MYFPLEYSKLESVLPESPLASLGADAAFLLLAKKNCGLPADPSWTELDDTIKGYIDAAEAIVDDLVICPYRPKTFILYLSPTYQADGSSVSGVDLRGRRFSAIRLPKAPTTVDDVTVEFLNTEDDDYTEITDFRLIGGNSYTPEIVFNRDFAFPQVNKPYPVKVTFETIADKQNPIQKMAILALTDYLFKNPEMMATKELINLPVVFWDMIARLGGIRYA